MRRIDQGIRQDTLRSRANSAFLHHNFHLYGNQCQYKGGPLTYSHQDSIDCSFALNCSISHQQERGYHESCNSPLDHRLFGRRHGHGDLLPNDVRTVCQINELIQPNGKSIATTFCTASAIHTAVRAHDSLHAAP
jgi:hypothetical protein